MGYMLTIKGEVTNKTWFLYETLLNSLASGDLESIVVLFIYLLNKIPRNASVHTKLCINRKDKKSLVCF